MSFKLVFTLKTLCTKRDYILNSIRYNLYLSQSGYEDSLKAFDILTKDIQYSVLCQNDIYTFLYDGNNYQLKYQKAESNLDMGVI